MRKYGRDYDEWLSTAQMGLCKAAYYFKSDKGLRFSTFAYTVMDNEMKMKFRDENTISRKAECVSISEGTVDDKTIEDIIGEPDYYEFEDKDVLLDVLSHMNEAEKKLMYLHFQEGLTQHQIGERMGFSQTHAHRKIKRLYSKLNEVYESRCLHG